VEALGCRVGALCLLPRPMTPATLSDDAELRITHMVGLTDAARERWGRFRVGDPLPASEAVRSNAPVVLPTIADRQRRFPALSGYVPAEEHALVVLPLSVGERRLGALTLSFFEEPEQRGDAGRTMSVVGGFGPGQHGTAGQQFFGDDDLAFVSSLAAACASALDRADAVRQLRSASNRLAFLAEASVELSSSLDYARTLARVAELAVPVLADWCSVATLAGEDLETLAVAHVQPEKVALAWQIQRRYPPNPDTAAAHRVLRTGRSEMYTGITDEQVEASAVDDEHRRMLREMGPLRALMLVPMIARGRTLGVLTLLSAGRDFEPSDLALAEDLGRRAALAVDNAALFRDASLHRDAGEGRDD
jgi:GAF domain-containing protein